MPQSIQSLEELKQITMVPTQIISPGTSKPCMKIMVDTMIGAYLLTKYEEFEKKFGIINNKLFFNFDLKLPKSIQCINEEVKISTSRIPLKRFLNHFI
jgi:DNA-directed RNA polymerase II subunit RPB1